MTKRFDWGFGSSGLADMSQEALKNYFLYAFQPGSFLTSLLCNESVVDVYRRADHWNKDIIGKYISWLDEVAPEGSWGSADKVKSWLNKGPAYQEFQKTIMWEALNEDHTEMKEQMW